MATSLLASRLKCFKRDAEDLVGGGTEGSDAGLFAFQVGRLFDLGTCHQTKRRNRAGGADDHDIAAGGSGGQRRDCAGLNDRRAAAKHGGDHPAAAADADQFDVQSFVEKVAGFLGDPCRRPGAGEAGIEQAHRRWRTGAPTARGGYHDSNSKHSHIFLNIVPSA